MSAPKDETATILALATIGCSCLQLRLLSGY